MARSSNPNASIKLEEVPSLSSLPTAHMKEEPSDDHINLVQQPTVTKADEIIKSVNELGSLSNAIHAFSRRYDELQKHLNFIQDAIETKQQEYQQKKKLLLAPLTAQTLPCLSNEPTATEDKDDKDKKPPPAASSSSPSRSLPELGYLCKMMCGRSLRKHILSNLADLEKLRLEVPSALKSGPNPSKLVLDCMGRFFVQGKKSFSKENSPLISVRKACVLVLECFLLGCSENGIQIDPAVKAEAEVAAIDWRKRIVGEGGFTKIDTMDARALLLFLASFGIPAVFTMKEIIDLVRFSNPREISDALRLSPFLLPRIPGIIEGMMNHEMNVKALEVVYTFGVEDKFSPQTILNSFLRQSTELWNKMKGEARGSLTALKKGHEKQLASLKSVMKCLEDHKIDPLKLSEWKISENVTNLEKDIADLERRIEEEKAKTKRKANEIDSSVYLTTEEFKRSRFDHGGALMSAHMSAYSTGLPKPHSYGDALMMHMHHGHGYGGGKPHGHGGWLEDDESLIGQQQSVSMVGRGLVGTLPSSAQGFTGLPTSPSATNRSSASDLYRFADAVLETEFSRKAGTVPPHHSSYLY